MEFSSKDAASAGEILTVTDVTEDDRRGSESNQQDVGRVPAPQGDETERGLADVTTTADEKYEPSGAVVVDG